MAYEMMNYKWYLMVLDQYMTILAGLRVSKSQGLMVSKSQAPKVSRYQGIKVSRSQGNNGSVWSCTGWYLVVLGHCGVLLVGTWWYRVIIGR